MQSYLPENFDSDSVFYELKDWPDPNVTVLIDAARELSADTFTMHPPPRSVTTSSSLLTVNVMLAFFPQM